VILVLAGDVIVEIHVTQEYTTLCAASPFAFGLPPHLTDEEIARQLDAWLDQSRAAQKAVATKRQKLAEQKARENHALFS